ncbi:MAG: alpha/beta hydrolase [Promethearchaeota archaeon]
MTLDVKALRKEYEGPHCLLTTSDGLTLFLRKWESQSETPRKSAVLILHGITAHSGPYSVLAEPLAERGFTVYGLDLRGHGMSDGGRGDCPSKDRYMKDICHAMDLVSQYHEATVVIGHSLGVLSTIFAMNHCLDKIDGAVLLSAGRSLRPGATRNLSPIQKVRIAVNSTLSPGKPVIKYEREGMVGLDDPLFTFKYSLRFMRLVSFDTERFPEKLDFPVFVGIGDSDEVFSVDSCKELYEEIPAESKEFHIAKDAKHAEFPHGSWSPVFTWMEKNFY